MNDEAFSRLVTRNPAALLYCRGDIILSASAGFSRLFNSSESFTDKEISEVFTDRATGTGLSFQDDLIDVDLLTVEATCIFDTKPVFTLSISSLNESDRLVYIIKKTEYTETGRSEQHFRDEVFSEMQQVAKVGSFRFYYDDFNLLVTEGVYHILELPQNRDSLKFSSLIKLVINHDRPRFTELFRNILRGRVPKDKEIRFRKNRSGHEANALIKVQITYDESGNPKYAAGTVQNVTRLSREQKRRHESEALYRLLAENMSGFIWMMDADFNFTYLSPSIEKLTGYTVDEYRLLSIEQRMSADSARRKRDMLNLLKNKSAETDQPTGSVELEYLCKDGSTVWVESTIRAVFKKEFEFETYIGQTENIANRVQAEASVREALKKAEEANRAKDRFLSVMSHELRTPLNAITGYTDLLSEHLEDEKLLKYIDNIAVSSEVLLALINDIMLLTELNSEKVSLQSETFNLKTLAREICDEFKPAAAEKLLELHLKTDELEKTLFWSDRNRFRKILEQLLDNAVKFTDRGGITVKLRYSSSQGLVISVSDSGQGIPSEEKQVIFNAFSKENNRKGTGLGLTIVSRLVRLMNGRIDVHDSQQGGAEFILSFRDILPAESSEEMRPEPVKSRSTETAVNKKIQRAGSVLIADDDAMSRQLITDMLKRTGVGVLQAADGDETVNRLRQSSIYLLLLDLNMPGAPVSEIIETASLSETGVYIISGAAEDELREKCRSLNISGYFQKPVRKKALLALVQQLKPASSEEDVPAEIEPVSIEEKNYIEQTFAPYWHESRRAMVFNRMQTAGEMLQCNTAENSRLHKLASELVEAAASFSIKRLKETAAALDDVIDRMSK